MNKNKIGKKIIIIWLLTSSINSKAEIFGDNTLNFFNEPKAINQIQNKNDKIKTHGSEIKISISDITVHSIKDLTKQELEFFPKNYLINCTDLKKSILYLNSEMLKKFKNEFDISDQVVFKEVNYSLYEIPFYFSNDEKCIFNKYKNTNSILRDKVISAVKTYMALKKR